MYKTVKAVAKKTTFFWSKRRKKAVAPVKEFVAGQLAFHDVWDDGRGNSTTTTRLVVVTTLQHGGDAVVVLEDGSFTVVGVKNLRHLPEVFKGATI